MATRQAALQAVRTRVNTQIEVAQSVPVYYDNAPAPDHNDELHVRAWVKFLRSEQVTVGPPAQVRHYGQLLLFIKEPILDGTKGTEDLLTAVTTADSGFQLVTVGGIAYRVPIVSMQGREPDGVYWQTNILCPWYTDEFVS